MTTIIKIIGDRTFDQQEFPKWIFGATPCFPHFRGKKYIKMTLAGKTGKRNGRDQNRSINNYEDIGLIRKVLGKCGLSTTITL